MYKLLSDIDSRTPDDKSAEKIKPWIRNDNKVIMHIKYESNSLITETIGYSEDSSSQPIKQILNNEKSTLYNRVIFYFLWKFNAVKIEVSDEIENISVKYGIPQENIIIRHGSDKMSHLKKILSPSLLRTVNCLVQEASGANIYDAKLKLVA